MSWGRRSISSDDNHVKAPFNCILLPLASGLESICPTSLRSAARKIYLEVKL